MLTLARGEERYTVPGGGAIAVPIHEGDRVRVVDVEGLQRCELVAVDVSGTIDPAILGARGDGDAHGLKQILSADRECARSVRSGLERRGIDLASARAVTLFGARLPPRGWRRVHRVARWSLDRCRAWRRDGCRLARYGDANSPSHPAQQYSPGE